MTVQRVFVTVEVEIPPEWVDLNDPTAMTHLGANELGDALTRSGFDATPGSIALARITETEN
jgi:hypothetical protein